MGNSNMPYPLSPSDVEGEIRSERIRQVQKGWTPQHDDEHCHGELAQAAASYATARMGLESYDGWPFGEPFVPKEDQRRNLIIAGAFIVAEIERIDRAERRALGRAASGLLNDAPGG